MTTGTKDKLKVRRNGRVVELERTESLLDKDIVTFNDGRTAMYVDARDSAAFVGEWHAQLRGIYIKKSELAIAKDGKLLIPPRGSPGLLGEGFYYQGHLDHTIARFALQQGGYFNQR